DYFAINASTEKFSALVTANPALQTVDLGYFEEMIGLNLHNRPGGAVSLAVGMAHIFHKIPNMDHLLAYWYNFAVMFEAVFILTAIDSGTRVGRFFLQEMLGRVIPRFNDKHWTPGIIITSLAFTFSWGYLVYTGNISSIWPLFGLSNQLLAACALIVCTTMLLRMNRGMMCLCTAIPGLFMAGVTFWAGYLQLTGDYIPNGKYLLALFACIVLVLMAFVFASAFMRWKELLNINTTKPDAFGDMVLEVVQE
ncbi:MAG: carbon starvation protein A, partial [Desulfovibrio sp.]|nr:carbon starvation protein A [Desulfovibrio sp.]